MKSSESSMIAVEKKPMSCFEKGFFFQLSLGLWVFFTQLGVTLPINWSKNSGKTKARGVGRDGLGVTVGIADGLPDRPSIFLDLFEKK